MLEMQGVCIDLVEHLSTLTRYASIVKRVTELGVRDGWSTKALIEGGPIEVNSFDLNPCPNASYLLNLAKTEAVQWQFTLADSLKLELPPTDLLFIDTYHSFQQLSAELTRFGHLVRQYIILHDTETFGKVGENGDPGLWFAIQCWMQSNCEWRLLHHYPNNNGLSILVRV